MKKLLNGKLLKQHWLALSFGVLTLALISVACGGGSGAKARILLEDSGDLYLIDSDDRAAPRDVGVDFDEDSSLEFRIFVDDRYGNARYLQENNFAVTPGGKRLTIEEGRGSSYIVERSDLRGASGDGTEISDDRLSQAWYHYNGDTLVLQEPLGSNYRCSVSSNGRDLEEIGSGNRCFPNFSSESVVVYDSREVVVYSYSGDERFAVDAEGSTGDDDFVFRIIDDGNAVIATRDASRGATELIWQKRGEETDTLAENDRVVILDSSMNSKWFVYATEDIGQGLELYVSDGNPDNDRLLGAGVQFDVKISPNGEVLLYSISGRGSASGDDGASFGIYMVELGSSVGEESVLYEASRPGSLNSWGFGWIQYGDRQLAQIWVSSGEEDDLWNVAWVPGDEPVDLAGSSGSNAIYPIEDMWVSISEQSDDVGQYNVFELFDESRVLGDEDVTGEILDLQFLKNGRLAIEIYEEGFEEIQFVSRDGNGLEIAGALAEEEIDPWYTVENRVFAEIDDGSSKVVTIGYGDDEEEEIEDRGWEISSVFNPSQPRSFYNSANSISTDFINFDDAGESEDFDDDDAEPAPTTTWATATTWEYVIAPTTEPWATTTTEPWATTAAPAEIPFYNNFNGFDDYIDQNFSGDLDDFISIYYGNNSSFCDQYYSVPGYSSYANDNC